MIDDGLPELTHGALAYDVRELRWSDPKEMRPVPTFVYRIVAALSGAWVLEDDCDALRGKHDEMCLHRDNDCRYTLRWLARTIAVSCGKSQRGQVSEVLEALATGEINHRTPGARGPLAPLLSIDPTGRWVQPGRAAWDQPGGRAQWRPDALEQLLAGHFQRVPIELIRLPGRTAFRTWALALLHCPLSRGAGEYSLTGPGIYYERTPRLGYASLSPAELRRALERDAAAGNAVQDVYRLEICDRRCRGLKLRLVRRRQRTNHGRARRRQAPVRLSEVA